MLCLGLTPWRILDRSIEGAAHALLTTLRPLRWAASSGPLVGYCAHTRRTCLVGPVRHVPRDGARGKGILPPRPPHLDRLFRKCFGGGMSIERSRFCLPLLGFDRAFFFRRRRSSVFVFPFFTSVSRGVLFHVHRKGKYQPPKPTPNRLPAEPCSIDSINCIHAPHKSQIHRKTEPLATATATRHAHPVLPRCGDRPRFGIRVCPQRCG